MAAQLEVGSNFIMGRDLYYKIISIGKDDTVKAQQIGDKENKDFPNEINLEKNQLNFVTLITDDDNSIFVGMKFKMGQELKYSIVSINNDYIKCNQLQDDANKKNNEFPNEVILEKNQLKFVECI